MALAWSLVDCLSWCHPERWRLHCLPVDCYSWSKLLPTIGHDFQLSCDGLQLGRRGAANFYCEFFHLAAFFISFMSSLTSRRISSIASAILYSCFVSIIFLS